jgi:predicted metal-dependent hydrolase
MDPLDWPPEFTLRKSKKAKRASIRINLYRKIEVVVPEKTRFFDPHAFIEIHKAWIQKHLSRTPGVHSPAQFVLPEEIVFPGLNCRYQVLLSPQPEKAFRLSKLKEGIKLSGDFTDPLKIKKKLIQWLNKEAGPLLYPHLIWLTETHGFHFETLKIRFMKSRWGSCSRAGGMTLNSQLLFLPLPLIHHVILHELCHTRYMSHGPRFWGLLHKVDPMTAAHDKALAHCQQYLPSWVTI